MNALIGRRYRIDGTLGRGGMGVVYRALDTATGELLAIKLAQLPEDDRRAAVVSQFAHEYHTLTQLAHPRIVAVRDYGIEDGCPYYTMELLGGNDLSNGGKLPWLQACALLRDVCSALSLLHSRRILHRDVTTRNIRVGPDGRAKLIDFGAMAPFGRTGQVVGTPQFMAPETLRQQPLDGRTDLFALGAAGYWVLTAEHAYPAAQLSALARQWSRPLRPPNLLERDIPDALSQLIVALLSLDSHARPSSAAEVLYRLEAIAGLPHACELEVAQAYLTTPRLVGRDRERARVQAALAEPAHGEVMLVAGPPGTGRSRLLDVLALEGKIAGRHVLQMDAATLPRKPFAGVHKLSAELAGQFVPTSETTSGLPAPPSDPVAGTSDAPGPTADRIQSDRLVRSLVRIAGRQPALLLIDNLDRADEATGACLLELGSMAKGTPLIIGVAVDPDRLSRKMRNVVGALSMGHSVVTLEGLLEDGTLELLRSVFGSVPNLKGIARWAQQVGNGVPKVTMGLAQHLVDTGIARFEGGRWTLRDVLNDLVLPDNIDKVVRARIDALTPAAREVGQTLSVLLPVELEAPCMGDFEALFKGVLGVFEIFRAVDELVVAEVLRPVDDHYVFASDGYASALAQTIDDERRQHLHARIAEYYLSVGDARAPAAPYHLWQAGQEERAFALTAQPLPAWMQLDDVRVRIARRPEGLALTHWAIDYIEASRPPPEVSAHIYSSALKLAAVADPSLVRCRPQALARFAYDCGRDLFDAIDSAVPQQQRLGRVYSAAQERWRNADERARGLPPGRGIEELSVATAALCAAYGHMLDVEGVRSLSGVVEPFVAFPAVALVDEVVEMTVRWSRGASTTVARLRVLERLAEPIPGLGEVARQGIINLLNYHCGLSLALDGRDDALACANCLVDRPFYSALGWDVRVSYYRHRGMATALMAALEQRALAALREHDADHSRGHGILAELAATVHTDDLMGLRTVLARVAANAEAYPGWRPPHLYARGCLQLMMGDTAAATSDLELACKLAPIGEHPIWELPLEALLRALVQAGAHERAATIAAEAEAEIHKRLIEPAHRGYLWVAFALCEAATGRRDVARTRLQQQLQVEQEAGSRGVAVGSLHETLAWIALLDADPGTAKRHVRMMADEYGPAASAGLVARQARLAEATERGARISSCLPQSGATAALKTARLEPRDLLTEVDPPHKAAIAVTLRCAARQLSVSDAALFTLEQDRYRLLGHTGHLDSALTKRLAASLEARLLSRASETPTPGRSGRHRETCTSTALTLDAGSRYEALPVVLGELETVLVIPCSSHHGPTEIHDLATTLAAPLSALQIALAGDTDDPA